MQRFPDLLRVLTKFFLFSKIFFFEGWGRRWGSGGSGEVEGGGWRLEVDPPDLGMFHRIMWTDVGQILGSIVVSPSCSPSPPAIEDMVRVVGPGFVVALMDDGS